MDEKKKEIQLIRKALRENQPEDVDLVCDSSSEIIPDLSHVHNMFEIRIQFNLSGGKWLDYSNISKIELVLPDTCHYILPPEINRISVTALLNDSRMVYVHRGIIRGRFVSKAQVLLNDMLVDYFSTHGGGDMEFDTDEFCLLLALVFSPDGFSDVVEKKSDVICEYIHNHYYDKELSIAEVANAVGYSLNYMPALMKSECGITPREYLIRYRLEQAQRLLLQKKYLVKEVAWLCGWGDPHYFSNMYRRYYGVSPSEVLRY
jgi:AraC-like DNA-binding protein